MFFWQQRRKERHTLTYIVRRVDYHGQEKLCILLPNKLTKLQANKLPLAAFS